jgi:hypothetical protein
MIKIRTIVSASILFTAMLVIALCRPLPAFAVSTLAISPAGEGIFLLQGIGIEDAAALEITVSYDTATLANPRVVEGPLIAGAMTAVNRNVPGMVRMAVIRLTPVKGSGVIAKLSFDRTGASSGRIISLSCKLANIKGASLPVLVRIYNGSETSDNKTQGVKK